MFTKSLLAAGVTALAFAALPGTSDAQQRMQRAQPANAQNTYAPTAPYQTETCEIFRYWVAESGVVFHCDGIAMVFDGGNEASSRVAAAAMLHDMAANQRAATVRFRIENHPACAEIDFTSYTSMFASGQCAVAVYVGNSPF